ncbi:MAG: hypothetical protein C4558_05275 [Dehalococcoidia bacterium]|nr:MAG: hypothetical protein C4558_05275 [Dehalococcoidia bacterium]
MTLPVTRRFVRSLTSSVIWYGLGLAVYAAVTVLLYPSVEATLRSIDLPPELLRFLGTEDIGTPTGYLTARWQSFAPIVLMIWGIVASTGLIAGEESRGSLDGLLSPPISRTRLMLEAMLAFTGCTFVILVAIAVAWVVTVPLVDLHDNITTTTLIAGTASMAPLALCFGAMGFFVGAIAPARGTAAGLLTALAITSYLVSSLSQVAPSIEWMRYGSPYYYADTGRVLRDGVDWTHQVGLLGATLVLSVLALLAFRGREIGVGVWQPLAFLRR